jgi:hypothetical protein
MKYYGIKDKIRREKITYQYAKMRTKANSVFSVKHRRFWKRAYQDSFSNPFLLKRDDNAIPNGKSLQLTKIITADLVRKEDTKKLQSGLRRLLRVYRSGNYFTASIEGVDKICARIEQMEETLFSTYDQVDCGIFEFHETDLTDIVKWFKVVIKYFNSDYLMVQFEFCFSEEKEKELEDLMWSDYFESAGYVHSSLTAKHNRTGAFKSYVVAHFNDDALKADKIYEFISCIEWQFYEKLKAFFPFALHNMGIIPPRIEVFKTDIDYREDNKHFWRSIGIASYNGQFLDENQKAFYRCEYSCRYEDSAPDNRIVYIFKDSSKDYYGLFQTESMLKMHLDFVDTAFLKLLFFRIMSKEAGAVIVKYNHKLDRIKLKKRKLKKLIKAQYQFIRDYDFYERLIIKTDWERILLFLKEEHSESDKLIRKYNQHPYTSYRHLYENAMNRTKQIASDFNVTKEEYDKKRNVLQNLADYKNTSRGIRLSILMLIVAAVTLFFVVFPRRAAWVANIIRDIYHCILGLFQ